jgi:hypothetical protein
MVLEESAPTMEKLTDTDMKAWKAALALNQPEDTDDKEPQGVGENQETDKNATEYYEDLIKKTQNIVQLFNNGSDVGIEAVIKALEALESLIFPHIEEATLNAKTALEELHSSLQKASGVSEETGVDSLMNNDIDAQMTPLEIEELKSAPALTQKASGVSEETGVDKFTDNEVDAQMTSLEIKWFKTAPASTREFARARLYELNESTIRFNKAQTESTIKFNKAQTESTIEVNKARAITELTLVLSLAQTVHSKTKEVDTLLALMATLTQAENTIDKGTAVVRDQSRRQKNLQKKADVQYRRESDQVFPNTPMQTLYQEAEPVTEESPFHKSSLRSLWKSLDENTKTIILGIHSSYNTFIKDSIILDRPGATKTGAAEETATNSTASKQMRGIKRARLSAGTDTTTSTSTQEEYNKNVEESMKILTKLFRHCIDGQSEEKESAPAANQESHYFPGPRGQEVIGAQPFFGSLLDAISCVAEVVHKQQCSLKRQTGSSAVESPKQDLNGSEEASHKEQVRSPPKNTCEKESAVQGRDGSFRFGDFVIKKNGCHIWVYRADTLPIVIEIKAFYRSDKAWEDLIINAVQQVLNHTSRYVRVGLNFAGAGVESHATGAIGSLAYIQVYALELKDPGTTAPSLAIVKSELLPLMKKDIFSQWIEKNSRDDDESDKMKPDEVTRILFPVTNDEDTKDDDVPFGLLTMFQLMMSSKSELFGQTRTSDDDLQLLASGAFGNVFLTKDNSVVKLSRHGRRAYLRAEEFAYKAVGHFGKEKRSFAHLAVATFKYASVVVGTITTTMPSLIINPVGTPLVRLGDITKEKEVLYNVVFDIALALQHMHTRNVAHNDVSLANVVVVRQASGRCSAVLVDLSLACPFTFEIPFFCGNPVYVHRDVHNDKPWEPRPFHDMAALGFLAAVLTSGSIVPWLGFSSPVRDTSSYVTRYQVAIKAIDQCLPDNKCRSRIKDWINLDKTKTILRSPCGCRRLVDCCGSKQCKCAKDGLKCLDECSCKKCQDESTPRTCTNSSSLPKFKPPNPPDVTYERPASLQV